MKTLRQKYSDLDFKISSYFNELIKKLNYINLVKDEYIDIEGYEDFSDCENISIINEISGNYLDLKVLQICQNNGIYVAITDDETNRFWISFYDISNLYDKITITELLYNHE